MTDGTIAERVLRIRGLGKDFGPNTVLDGIDFEVGRGETVCMPGPSGSGKSTLVRCINWLERPDRDAASPVLRWQTKLWRGLKESA